MIDHKLTSCITHIERTRCTPGYYTEDTIQYKLTENTKYNDNISLYVNPVLYIYKGFLFFDKIEYSSRLEFSLRTNIPCYKVFNTNYNNEVPHSFRSFIFTVINNYRKKLNRENSISILTLMTRMTNLRITLKDVIFHMRKCINGLIIDDMVEITGEKRYYMDYSFSTGEERIKSVER